MKAKIEPKNCYRVIGMVLRESGKGMTRRVQGIFPKRQQARQFCRNHQYQFEKLVIVHPDGKKEVWNRGEANDNE